MKDKIKMKTFAPVLSSLSNVIDMYPDFVMTKTNDTTENMTEIKGAMLSMLHQQ